MTLTSRIEQQELDEELKVPKRFVSAEDVIMYLENVSQSVLRLVNVTKNNNTEKLARILEELLLLEDRDLSVLKLDNEKDLMSQVRYYRYILNEFEEARKSGRTGSFIIGTSLIEPGSTIGSKNMLEELIDRLKANESIDS